MLAPLVLLNLLLYQVVCASEEDDSDFGTNIIINSIKHKDRGLSDDDEYDDLQAELQAYHTALAKLTEPKRRSMMTTPCWQLGGICVNKQLCTGFRFLSEVPGCKNRLNVCCFAWNRFKITDFRQEDIDTLALPWSLQKEFGGLGVMVKNPLDKKKNSKNHRKHHKNEELNIEIGNENLNLRNLGALLRPGNQNDGIIISNADSDGNERELRKHSGVHIFAKK